MVQCSPLGMGVEEPVGHMDFYPNNGTDQPGCDQNMWSTITGLDGLMDGVRDFVACNHLRSIKYFNESLTLNQIENITAMLKYASLISDRSAFLPTPRIP